MNDKKDTPYTRLGADFYQREDVVQVARDLIGKYLVTHFPEGRSVGRIVETEAYRAPDDRASHAWNNRLTPRTRVMFEPGGRAYVYLCYGIHHLFNVVTGPEGMAHAVLIRAVEPVENVELMLQRRGMTRIEPRLANGPGALSQALGIRTEKTGASLLGDDALIWLEDRLDAVQESAIIAGPRIGVEYAGDCALRPWRFRWAGSRWAKP